MRTKPRWLIDVRYIKTFFIPFGMYPTIVHASIIFELYNPLSHAGKSSRKDLGTTEL